MSQIFFYYILSLLLYAAIRVLNFYFFARNEAGIFLRLTLLQFSLNIAFDFFYVFVLHLGAIGIPLGLLTSAGATCGVAFYRNLGDIRGNADRSLGMLAVKTALGVAIVMAILDRVKYRLGAPQTSLGNLAFLLKLGVIELLIFAAVLSVTRAVRVSQLATLWGRMQ